LRGGVRIRAVSEDEKKSLTVAIYSDAASPAIKEVGNVGGRLVRMALAPLRGFVWSYERIEEWIEKEVGKRLEGIPAERIQAPAPEVVVPALTAVAYTQAEEPRAMFAALLAKSMDSTTARDVHPSFVEVIKQLTPDEARILSALSAEPEAYFFQFQPFLFLGVDVLVDGVLDNPEVPYFSDLFKRAGCWDLDRASVAISNLKRQNLTDFSRHRAAQPVWVARVDPALARLMKENESMRAHVERAIDEELPLRVDKLAFQLTPFGRQFCAVCVDRLGDLNAAAPEQSPTPPPPTR